MATNTHLPIYYTILIPVTSDATTALPNDIASITDNGNPSYNDTVR
mgnify:CR=1 FL=1